MKQFWLGAGLMAVILACGFWLGGRLEDTHHPQAKDLEKAAACALDGDWALASALVTRAQKGWKNSRNLAAALVHHDPLSKIDTLFAELSVHVAARNTQEFSATCAGLAQTLRSLPESHSLKWWNLL